jgi:hypothetical protein
MTPPAPSSNPPPLPPPPPPSPVGLVPILIALLTPLLTTLFTLLLSWFLLTTFSIPLHPRELLAAALINAFAGVAAAIFILRRLPRGVTAVAQAGLISIGIRMGLVLLALLAALAPTWSFDRISLLLFALVFYFPLLISESIFVAWLIRQVNH